MSTISIVIIAILLTVSVWTLVDFLGGWGDWHTKG